MPFRFTARKPDVVSVSFGRQSAETSAAKSRIPSRRERPAAYLPPSANREPTTTSASPATSGGSSLPRCGAEGRAPAPPRAPRGVLAALGDPRADDDVRLARDERCEQLAELRRVVLAVSVDLNSELEAVLECVAVAGLDGAADAEVEREAQDDRAVLGVGVR